MNRLKFSILSTLIFVIFPLIPEWDKILTVEILYVIISIFILNFTQPALNKLETEENKESDNNTVIFIILATGFSIAIPIFDWAHMKEPQTDLTWLVPGVLLNIAGLAFRAWSIRILGRHFTATVQIKEDHRLIRTGPYKYLRHPSYTGALISTLSYSIILQSLPGVLFCIVLMGTAYYFRIRAEEKKLKDHFGDEYTEYSSHSYKLIPFIW